MHPGPDKPHFLLFYSFPDKVLRSVETRARLSSTATITAAGVSLVVAPDDASSMEQWEECVVGLARAHCDHVIAKHAAIVDAITL